MSECGTSFFNRHDWKHPSFRRRICINCGRTEFEIWSGEFGDLGKWWRFEPHETWLSGVQTDIDIIIKNRKHEENEKSEEDGLVMKYGFIALTKFKEMFNNE